MAARKKSGRLYIRMDPDIHARVSKTAKALGMDINGLLNLILRTGLPSYEHMAIHGGDARQQQANVKAIENITQLSEAVRSLWQQFFPDAETAARTGQGFLSLLNQLFPNLKVSVSHRSEQPQPQSQPAPELTAGKEPTAPEKEQP